MLWLLKTCKTIVQIKGGLHFRLLFKFWETFQNIMSQNKIRARCVQIGFYSHLNVVFSLFCLFGFHRRNQWLQITSHQCHFHTVYKSLTMVFPLQVLRTYNMILVLSFKKWEKCWLRFGSGNKKKEVCYRLLVYCFTRLLVVHSINNFTTGSSPKILDWANRLGQGLIRMSHRDWKQICCHTGDAARNCPC